jgi:glycosyltransferase involved in cell wall biosynthesis
MNEQHAATYEADRLRLSPAILAAGRPDHRLAEAVRGRRRGRELIVHLIKHCGHANGSVHVAVDLACAQAQAGYDVIVASSGGTFVEMLQLHGVRHYLMLQDLRAPLSTAATIWQLLQLCRTEKPLVIHAHMMGSASAGYLVSRVTGSPLVTTVHNSFDRHSVIMRLGDRVVAVSHAERKNLLARGYPPEKVAVVVNAPNNSPREAFMHTASPTMLARPCITAICGLHRRKGVFNIINAFTAVAKAFPEWRLYIAGEGPDEDELRSQAKNSGLADRIVFLGFVAAPQSLFAQADIFVLASYADPGSLSIGEARAAGCAIIATAVGGTPEMLDDGKAGRLVPPGDPDALAAEFRLLMGDPALRASLQAAALDGAAAFDCSELVGRYDKVYREAAGARKRFSTRNAWRATPDAQQ